jgi:hypothetical protein
MEKGMGAQISELSYVHDGWERGKRHSMLCMHMLTCWMTGCHLGDPPPQGSQPFSRFISSSISWVGFPNNGRPIRIRSASKDQPCSLKYERVQMDKSAHANSPFTAVTCRKSKRSCIQRTQMHKLLCHSTLPECEATTRNTSRRINNLSQWPSIP